MIAIENEFINPIEFVYNEAIFGYVYLIRNSVNNKIYIGKSTNMKSRIRQYRYLCNNNKPSYQEIITDMKSIGFDKFTFELLDEAYDNNDLNEKEIYWMDYAIDMNCGLYNDLFLGGGGGFKGQKGRPQSINEKIKKSKKIIAYKDGCFIFSDSAKLFADYVNLERTNVIEGIKKCKKVRGYFVYYADINLRNEQMKFLKKRIIKYKSSGKHKHLVPEKLEMIRISKLLCDDVETIEKDYNITKLNYDLTE